MYVLPVCMKEVGTIDILRGSDFISIQLLIGMWLRRASIGMCHRRGNLPFRVNWEVSLVRPETPEDDDH